ncbi:MAG: alanine racemase [Chloroflexota bacterium]
MQTVNDLETPTVLIDMDIVERNIAEMQKRCDDLGIHFRPHIKTHKIPAFAHMQLAAGASGIACQKVSEAEVFADAGITDIQIPYNIVGERKTARLAQLAKRVTLTVTADSAPVIDGIAAAAHAHDARIHMMVELVALNRRTGTTPQTALELAKRIVGHKNLDFAGIMIYPSNVGVRPRLQETLQLLADADIAVKTVSGGGSGAALEVAQMPELTELRVGTYIFYDFRSVMMGWAKLENCAMTVKATVVSANEPDRVILDSGSKTLTSELVNSTHGYIVEYPEATLYRLNEEHGFVDMSAYETLPTVGEAVHIIPVHTCVVTNMHNQVYAVRGEAVEQPYPVAARGLVW